MEASILQDKEDMNCLFFFLWEVTSRDCSYMTEYFCKALSDRLSDGLWIGSALLLLLSLLLLLLLLLLNVVDLEDIGK